MLRLKSSHRFTGMEDSIARGYLGVEEGVCSCAPSSFYSSPNLEVERSSLVIESKEMLFSFEL